MNPPSAVCKRPWLALGLALAATRAFAGGGYEYVAPEKTGDGWEVAALSDVKLDASLIKELFDRINDNSYKNITSVIVVKDGKLAIEEYFPRQEVLGARRSRALKRLSPQQLYSATKSVTSILVGIAIERGQIKGVDQKISTFLPEYADVFADGAKVKLQLKDLLSMSAGLAWDEWNAPYADPRNDALQSLLQPDPLRYVVERPVVAPPGQVFAYNTGISLLLGRIVSKASGLRADKFAERNLFEPLGITDFYWAKVPEDNVETGGGLFMRPRDMAKIGYLYLNGGRWQGKQIVLESWVKESIKNQAGTMKLPAWLTGPDGYGYQWWLGSLKANEKNVRFYGALGRGGQFILDFPEQNMVTVFTGMNDNILMNQPLEMLQRYILPAAMPPNPAAPK